MTQRPPAPRSSDPLTAALLAAFCCLLWGSAYSAIKIGYELLSIASGDLAGKFLFAGCRFVLAGLFVLAIAKVSGRKLALGGWSEILSVAGLGLVQTGLQYSFFYVGLANTSGAKASVMNSMGSFFSAILAHFLYRNDKLDLRKTVGCILGFAGVVAVNWSGDLLFDWRLDGEGFIAISALVFAAASLWGRRLSMRIDPMVLTGWQLLTGGSSLAVMGFALGGQLGPFSLAAILDLVYLATLSAVAFTIWTILLRNNKVTSITVFYFLIPVSGVILSVLVLGDSVFEWRYLVALAVVSGGILLVNMGGKRKT
jgi:drug/metabolite transporter (DMT)-like permease